MRKKKKYLKKRSESDMTEDELSPEYLEKMAETEKGARKLIEAVIDILADVAREPSDEKIERLGTFVTTYSKAILTI